MNIQVVALRRSKQKYLIGFLACLSGGVLIGESLSVLALPAENDIPEEVLATEIIIQGRSSIDNQPLNVSEYTAQKEDDSESKYPPDVDSQLKHNIFLLKVFKMLRTIVPIK